MEGRVYSFCNRGGGGGGETSQSHSPYSYNHLTLPLPPPHHLTPPPHHLGDNLLTAVSVARECGMIEPDHQAIMVKADLDGAGSDVRLVYHLLGEGKDLAELLQSGQATPKAANGEPALSPALSSCLVPSPFILSCPQPFHLALSPVLSSCLVPSPLSCLVPSPGLSCLVPSPLSCLVPSRYYLFPCPQTNSFLLPLLTP